MLPQEGSSRPEGGRPNPIGASRVDDVREFQRWIEQIRKGKSGGSLDNFLSKRQKGGRRTRLWQRRKAVGKGRSRL
jgi:hypothetical protein